MDALFAAARSDLETTDFDLARGRARVTQPLAQDAHSGSGVLRRLAYGGAGDGGLWAAAVGVAAAHKLAAAGIGVAVLLSGGVPPR